MTTTNTQTHAVRDAGQTEIRDLGQNKPRRWTVVSWRDGAIDGRPVRNFYRTRLKSRTKALSYANSLLGRISGVRVEKGWSFGNQDHDLGAAGENLRQEELEQNRADPGYSN